MTTISLEMLSTSLREARRMLTAITPLTNKSADLSLEDAYQIQRLNLEFDIGAGERLAGYKIGLTSKAKQRDVNVFEPIRGYLLASMELPYGSPLRVKESIHPRVEPEIALTFKDRLASRSVTVRELVASLEGIYPAVEILDSRYENFQFKLPDVIADNTSARGFLLGTTNLLHSMEDLRLLGVTVRKNGVIETTGAPAAVLGHPFTAAIGLVQSLVREDLSIEPGMVVLTGGITASLTVAAGDCIEVCFPTETLTIKAE